MLLHWLISYLIWFDRLKRRSWYPSGSCTKRSRSLRVCWIILNAALLRPSNWKETCFKRATRRHRPRRSCSNSWQHRPALLLYMLLLLTTLSPGFPHLQLFWYSIMLLSERFNDLWCIECRSLLQSVPNLFPSAQVASPELQSDLQHLHLDDSESGRPPYEALPPLPLPLPLPLTNLTSLSTSYLPSISTSELAESTNYDLMTDGDMEQLSLEIEKERFRSDLEECIRKERMSGLICIRSF